MLLSVCLTKFNQQDQLFSAAVSHFYNQSAFTKFPPITVFLCFHQSQPFSCSDQSFHFDSANQSREVEISWIHFMIKNSSKTTADFSISHQLLWAKEKSG